MYAYKYLVTVCPCGRTTTTFTELRSMGQPVCPSYQEGHVGCLPGDELVRPGRRPPGDRCSRRCHLSNIQLFLWRFVSGMKGISSESLLCSLLVNPGLKDLWDTMTAGHS